MSTEEKKNKILGVVFTTIFMTALAVCTVAALSGYIDRTRNENEEEQKKIDSYKSSISNLSKEKDELQKEIDDYNARYSEYLGELGSKNEDFYAYVERYNMLSKRYSFLGGLTRVKGAGIVINLDDGNPVSGTISSYMLVHDSTLISILNSLRSAGAQAISINDERIVSMTEVICTGTSITVNGHKLFAPFTIKAIGDSDNLYSSFTGSATYRSLVFSELKLDVSKKDEIIIAKYSG